MGMLQFVKYVMNPEIRKPNLTSYFLLSLYMYVKYLIWWSLCRELYGIGRGEPAMPYTHWSEIENSIRKLFGYFKTCHCWYIEPRKREKSLRLVWQHFSCLLDDWIAKIYKKKKFHDGFLRYNPHYPFWDLRSEKFFGIWY